MINLFIYAHLFLYIGVKAVTLAYKNLYLSHEKELTCFQHTDS